MTKIAALLLMGPVLTLFLVAEVAASHERKMIAVDPETGTRFSIEDQDHEFPMFNNCLGRGSGNLRVIGEIPSGVSLLDDRVAQRLMEIAFQAVGVAWP